MVLLGKSTAGDPPRHRHEFTALWAHFGTFGDPDRSQTHHYHPCFTEGCNRVLIGQGRECSGKDHDHERKTL